MTFCSLIIYNDNPPPIRLYSKPWPWYQTRPFTELWEVSIEHLRQVWHANRGRLLLHTPVPVRFFDLHMFCWLTSILFPNLSLFFRTMHFEHLLVLSRFCLMSISVHFFKISITFYLNMGLAELWVTASINDEYILRNKIKTPG